MEGAALASMVPEAHMEMNFDPNGPGMGLDLDFNNFDVGNIDSDALNVDCDAAYFGYNNMDFDFGDLDINIGSGNNANFNFEDVLNEAELSLGPREEFQEANMSFPVAPPMELPIEKSEALTHPSPETSSYNPGTSTLQEPVHSNEMRAQKWKKVDEVDAGQILPEGSRRNRSKTARAQGLDSLA